MSMPSEIDQTLPTVSSEARSFALPGAVGARAGRRPGVLHPGLDPRRLAALIEDHARCPRCLFQRRVCLCAAIPTVVTRTRIVIVRHPPSGLYVIRSPSVRPALMASSWSQRAWQVGIVVTYTLMM